MKIDNLVGKTFGELKVIKIGEPYITPGGQKKTVWLCECSCGNPLEIRSHDLLWL